MGMHDTRDLHRFLKPFPDQKKQIALALREFAWKRYPDANELIYDNYNAVALGWSLTDRLGDTFCSIAVGRRGLNVHFGFFWGSKLSDPKKLLLGSGNQYRYIIVEDMRKFPRGYIAKLMKQAHAYSLTKLKKPSPPLHGTTIVKSISAKKANIVSSRSYPRRGR